MARRADYQIALTLRREGKSYSQIKKELKISKSTLSVWLRKYPLTKQQLHLLRDVSEVRIEKFRQTMRDKRERKLKLYYEEQKQNLLPLSERELFIAGLFLYLGEGNKASRSALGIYNTDPSIIQFSLLWLTKCLGIPKTKIRVSLQLYNDMDIAQTLTFWRKALLLPKSSFTKPYVKKSLRSSIDHKGFGYGTCGLIVHDTILKEKILMAMKVVMENYSHD